MRLYRSIALALFLILALLASNVITNAQIGNTVVYLDPASSTINVGQEIDIHIWADDVSGFYGAQFELTFDTTILKGLRVDPGTAFTTYPSEFYLVMQNDIHSGAARFAATLLRIPLDRADPPPPGPVHLATVSFEGLSPGTSGLIFDEGSVKLSDMHGQAIPLTASGGQITVDGGPPPTMGTLLKGVVVDEARNLVYVAVQSDNTVAIVDATTHDVVNAVPCGGVGPNGLALSEDGSKLFVVNSGSNQVAVLDASSAYDVIATIDVGRNPFGVAIANGIAYVTNFDDATVTLIDVSTMSAFNTVSVGHHPALPAAIGDRAYVPIHSAYTRWASKDPADEWNYVQANKGQDTGVAIVYSDGRVERVLQEYIGFFAAAADLELNRVYITKRDGTAEGLYVLDATDNSLLTFVPMLRPYAVAVNLGTRYVFVVQGDMDEVYVLHANDDEYRLIRAVNTAPNNGDIPGMHGGQGIDVGAGQAFASNFASGTLAILDAASTAGDFAVPIDVEYIRGWQESGGNHGPLGEPAAPASSYWYSEQQYERGSLHWRQSTPGLNSVYVFDMESTQTTGTAWTGRDSGVWQRYDDNWVPGMPLFPAGCPDAWWPYGPMFGFGVTWCDEPGVKDTIGKPIGWEYGTLGGDQTFANGTVFWNPASDAYYVLRNDTMRWQYYRAHRRYDAQDIEPNVTGQVRLQGRSQHGGVILLGEAGMRIASQENGQFGLHYAGQTTLRIHHPGYLDVQATIKADPNVYLDIGEIELLGGDVNGDNRIDILDIAYVGYRFSTADARADLNEDGVIDILDLALVGANFGQAGPVLWQR